MIPVVPSPEVCVRCKGRLWCGPRCFILERFEAKQKTIKSVKGLELQSQSPPGVFVGWHGYPKVSLSPMATSVPVSDSWLTDDTDKWFGLSAEKIIGFRESLIRGSLPVKVESANNPDYKIMEIQETLMAKKPVEIEMKLKSSPVARSLSFSDFHAPMGPSAGLAQFKTTSNPSVNQKIDCVVSDTGLKARDAIAELFKSGVGVNQLHKLLSAGMLGEKKKRKFVPTRWSIVSVDSNLSEYFVEEKIKGFPKIGEVKLFQSNYLENYYFVLLLPLEWSYELLEVWKPGALWNLESKEPTFAADHEFYGGRKSYAENTAGGYYAVRIALSEYLLRVKKQAAAVVFREIGDAGTPSLGVFKCRETARDALKKNPVCFESLPLALKYLETKLSIPLKYWVKKSTLLDNFFHQKKLSEFV